MYKFGNLGEAIYDTSRNEAARTASLRATATDLLAIRTRTCATTLLGLMLAGTWSPLGCDEQLLVGEAQASIGGSGSPWDGGTAANAGLPTTAGLAAEGRLPAEGGTSAVGDSKPTETTRCTIGLTTYQQNAVNPDNPCEACLPASSLSLWTALPEGTRCGDSRMCHDGLCDAGCNISGTYYTSGASNPDNSCEACQPARSTATWSTVTSSACPQAIAAGTNHSCVLVAGGIQCWGGNFYGQLGDNSTVDSPWPVRVQKLDTGAQTIVLPYQNVASAPASCTIIRGAAKCWGSNHTILLGDSPAPDSSVPFQMPGLESGVQFLAASWAHCCAVVNGGAQCWGYNQMGQLGDGATTQPMTSTASHPTQVQGLDSGVTSVAVGSYHSCAVVNGGVQCWGDGGGVLGNNSTMGSTVPVQVRGLNSGVQAVVAGASFNCALVNGAVLCWGANDVGQLGNNTTLSSSVPVQVRGLDSGVQRIAAGQSTACAVVNGGAVCWGENMYGQLGNDSKVRSSVPVLVQGLESGVTAIAVGAGHTCALANGSAYCWGQNYAGQLGDGTTDNRSVPGPPIKLL